MQANQMDKEKIKVILDKSLKIIQKYDWLINSYVMDFYVDNHWNKLPESWRLTFDSISPNDFTEILTTNETSEKLWPLSILALKALFKQLCISRNMKINSTHYKSTVLTHPKLKNLFTKSVKLKKRHEIEEMAIICYENAIKTGTNYIVDFGAGLGHLSRVLAYGYGLKVCCLEMREEFNLQAEFIDKHLEKTARKFLPEADTKDFTQPVHLTLTLSNSITSTDFIKKIKSALKIPNNCDENFKFGIIGLHPCGDLAAILINIFLSCREVKFLNLVGCCYMKLTSAQNNSSFYAYPLSKYLRTDLKINTLSYESREIACHAIEMYAERLKCGNYQELKIHSYRAALEKIIRHFFPGKKHLGMRNIKHTKNLEFFEYCEKAVKSLAISFNSDDILLLNIENDLKKWKNIVIFYTMRLFFAPLIESIILNDRILYLIENDCNSKIEAIFDPLLSPRNHITTAIKKI